MQTVRAPLTVPPFPSSASIQIDPTTNSISTLWFVFGTPTKTIQVFLCEVDYLTMTKNPFTKVKRVHRDRYDVYCDGEYSWTFIERVSGKWFVSHEECGRGSEAFTRFIDAKNVATAVVEVEADKMAEAEYQRSMAVGPDDGELMFELRANFEPGSAVVNVLTGERWTV